MDQELNKIIHRAWALVGNCEANARYADLALRWLGLASEFIDALKMDACNIEEIYELSAAQMVVHESMYDIVSFEYCNGYRR